MAYKRNVEIFEEAYEKKDAKSVVSYVARDGRKRYIAGNKNPDGGGTPMPSGGGMVEVKWQELKDKRDAGELTAGTLYRITDYNCTTTQENTQSANHQFDIVLLALSEDKLAEEGWAMMHDNDVYSVICSDGVSIKVYINIIYQEGDEDAIVNMVLTDSHLGTPMIIPYESISAIVDETTKTINLPIEVTSTQLLAEMKEDLPYSYFQNSNLSAWKVWYCLDNDKSRFAWAQVGQEGELVLTDDTTKEWKRDDNTMMDKVYNNETYYSWKCEGVQKYIKEEHPSVGSKFYQFIGPPFAPVGVQETGTIVKVTDTSVQEGKGVIYRLIDEWNNDCPYDFKNILYLRQLTAGVIDAQGTDTYIPTFCLYDIGNTEYRDASIFAIYYPSDENIIGACYDNIIKMVNTSDIEECYASELPNNIILELVETGDTSWQTHSNIIFAKSCSFGAIVTCNVIYAYGRTYTNTHSGIIFENQQVVWENIS